MLAVAFLLSLAAGPVAPQPGSTPVRVHGSLASIEADLKERINTDPGRVGTYLELASLYEAVEHGDDAERSPDPLVALAWLHLYRASTAGEQRLDPVALGVASADAALAASPDYGPAFEVKRQLLDAEVDSRRSRPAGRDRGRAAGARSDEPDGHFAAPSDPARHQHAGDVGGRKRAAPSLRRSSWRRRAVSGRGSGLARTACGHRPRGKGRTRRCRGRSGGSRSRSRLCWRMPARA